MSIVIALINIICLAKILLLSTCSNQSSCLSSMFYNICIIYKSLRWERSHGVSHLIRVLRFDCSILVNIKLLPFLLLRDFAPVCTAGCRRSFVQLDVVQLYLSDVWLIHLLVVAVLLLVQVVLDFHFTVDWGRPGEHFRMDFGLSLVESVVDGADAAIQLVEWYLWHVSRASWPSVQDWSKFLVISTFRINLAILVLLETLYGVLDSVWERFGLCSN